MKFNKLIPELTVSDIEKTKKFYVDVLGFNLEYERMGDKFIFLSFEDIQIMFEQFSEDGWNVGALDHPYGRGINFEMCISNVEEKYEQIIDFGVKPYREMSYSSYRQDENEVLQKEFLIQDPDGYLLRFTN